MDYLSDNNDISPFVWYFINSYFRNSTHFDSSCVHPLITLIPNPNQPLDAVTPFIRPKWLVLSILIATYLGGVKCLTKTSRKSFYNAISLKQRGVESSPTHHHKKGFDKWPKVNNKTKNLN
jgi:hypothetical protein